MELKGVQREGGRHSLPAVVAWRARRKGDAACRPSHIEGVEGGRRGMHEQKHRVEEREEKEG
jgi:hypothetical protein